MNEENQRSDSVSLISPSNETSKCRAFFATIDIFSFLPVPKGDQISTKRSICGSLTVYVLFLSYVAYCLYEFFAHNIPSTNQYFIPLPDSLEADTPPFAFAFMTGENLNETVHNKSYFDYLLEQVTIYKDPNIPRNYSKITHHRCRPGELDWINSSLTQFLLCPKIPTQMKGLLYSSDVHKYSRIVFILCNTSNSSANCAPKEEIMDLLGKGRLFFFLKKPSNTDYATNEDYSGGFYLKYYFIVPGLYNRAELQIQVEDTFIYPDWLTRMKTEKTRTFKLSNEQFYVSKTPNDLLGFQVWMRLDASISKSEIKYSTIVDYISKWGALWSVCLTVGALYFLRYNKSQFYSDNPEWNEFEAEIAIIRSLHHRVRNPSQILRNSQNLRASRNQ